MDIIVTITCKTHKTERSQFIVRQGSSIENAVIVWRAIRKRAETEWKAPDGWQPCELDEIIETPARHHVYQIWPETFQYIENLDPTTRNPALTNPGP